MILYHASLNLDIINEFTPIIPDEDNMIDSEDTVTPRICLAKTIKGCLTAVPWGGGSIEEIFFDNMKSQLIRIYEFDITEIPEKNFVSSKKLYESDKVRDAEISTEVWVINRKLKPIKTYIIQVTDYGEGNADDISYEDLKNFNEHEDDLEDIINGCFTTIEYIKYDVIKESDYNPKLLFNFKIKEKIGDNHNHLNDVSPEFMLQHFNIDIAKKEIFTKNYIYTQVSKFLSENWSYYDIDIKRVDIEDVFLIGILVDISDKPTTKENFLELFKNDILTQKFQFIS